MLWMERVRVHCQILRHQAKGGVQIARGNIKRRHVRAFERRRYAAERIAQSEHGDMLRITALFLCANKRSVFISTQ